MVKVELEKERISQYIEAIECSVSDSYAATALLSELRHILEEYI